jgi:hypothetical protein
LAVPIPGRAFAPVIVVIPYPAEGCKPGEYDREWLPRQCAACSLGRIVGHGRRRRPAHDAGHDWIQVRRGICKLCGRTLTALPWWCVPRALYSLRARQEAIQRLVDGQSAEQAAPDCLDPGCVADASTIRRWAWRRRESLPLWLVAARHLFCAPTILAWDFRAAAGMLWVEASPP